MNERVISVVRYRKFWNEIDMAFHIIKKWWPKKNQEKRYIE